MAYQGQIIGRTSDGAEVRQLTEGERSGGEWRYALMDESHWCPADFFARYAVELEQRAAKFREAARIIEDADLVNRGGKVLRVTAMVKVEDDQEGRYVVGWMDDDELPWWAVDRDKAASLYSFPTKEAAQQLVAAMNLGDIARADRCIAAE